MSKYNIRNDVSDTINDLVSHITITLPEAYKKRKGTAKAMVYVLMSQYLIHKLRFDTALRRDKKMLIYLEDIKNSDEHISVLYEIEFDELTYMKEVLLDQRELFERLENKTSRKIALQILKVIVEEPKTDNYIKYIAKRCKCGLTAVYDTVRVMRGMVVRKNLMELSQKHDLTLEKYFVDGENEVKDYYYN